MTLVQCDGMFAFWCIIIDASYCAPSVVKLHCAFAAVVADLPLRAELVLDAAIAFAPERLLQLHIHRTAFLQLMEYGFDFIQIGADESQGNVVALNIRHSREDVGEHDIASVNVDACMHD
ncbi:hypothetical protein D3C77_447840 [compost metagenome]